MVLPREELETIQSKNKRRNRIIWLSVLAALVIAITLYVLFNFTDVIFGLSEDLTSTTPENAWTMFRHDLKRTGYLGETTTEPQGELAWTFETGASIHSSPAVVDGVVYFGSQDHYIYAVDAYTGEQIWAYETGSWVEASPVVSNSVVYCGSNDGDFYALDAATGELKWVFESRFPIRSTAAIANGKAYFGSDDWAIYAVNLDTGELAWKTDTDNLVLSSPLVIRGVVVVGGADDFVYCLNAENGSVRLKFDTRGMVVSSPAEKDGDIYCLTATSTLYKIDPTAKNWWGEHVIKKYWDALYIYGVAPKPPVPSGFLWSQTLSMRVNSTSSPAISRATLYAGAGSQMISLDLDSGEHIWDFNAGQTVTSSPAIGESAVYFGSYDGKLYAVDRATGDLVWSGETGGKISSSPALAEGMVFVGSHDGNMYAFK